MSLSSAQSVVLNRKRFEECGMVGWEIEERRGRNLATHPGVAPYCSRRCCEGDGGGRLRRIRLECGRAGDIWLTVLSFSCGQTPGCQSQIRQKGSSEGHPIPHHPQSPHFCLFPPTKDPPTRP